MAFLPTSAPHRLPTPRGLPPWRQQLRLPPPPPHRSWRSPRRGARTPAVVAASSAAAGTGASSPPPPTPLLADTTTLVFTPTGGTTTPARGEATLLDVALRVGALRIRPGDDDWCRTGGCYRCEVEVSPGGEFVRSCQVPVGPAEEVVEGGRGLGGETISWLCECMGGGGDDEDDDDGWDVV
ncbi:hypothetical protein MMPV_002533 [Pyropia vietnamensis]